MSHSVEEEEGREAGGFLFTDKMEEREEEADEESPEEVCSRKGRWGDIREPETHT